MTSARQWTIFYCDDDPRILRLYAQAVFARISDQVEARGFLSGRDLLAAVSESESVDLIITDFQMPGMSGVALVQALRDMDLAIPVIVATGDPDNARLFKPFRFVRKVVSKGLGSSFANMILDELAAGESST